MLRLASIFLLLFLAGCECIDPLEPLNRQFFAFNMVLDRSLLRPVAKVYDKVVPPYVACRVGNFFDNIDDLTNIANNALQFKLLDAWSDCWRFAFNTTFGLLGLYDVATCAGLPKHHQDFGLTLARYGFVNSMYLMVPFFGPSTLRDTIGWTVDWRYLSPWPYIRPNSLRYGLYGLRLVHKRAGLLAADPLIDDAMDPYLFVRDAYLQRRECEIKSICPPPCEDSPEKAKDDPKKAGDDTFVAEDDAKGGNADPNDTFVPEEENKSSSQASDDPFVDDEAPKTKASETQEAKPNVAIAKKAAVSGDPFIDP